jgi:stress response protein YsnF
MAGIRNFFADLFGSNDAEEVGAYAEAVRRGGAVVKVDVDEETEVDKARETLQQAGAIDIDEKVEEWRASGWSPTAEDFDARASAPSSMSVSAASEKAQVKSEDVIPVVKEDLAIGKRTVGTGGVRVYSRVVETPVEETVDLKAEHAEVKRRPVDRPVTEADMDAVQDKTIEVQETAEKAVVQKSARVVEEVSVGKTVETRKQTVRDKLRNTKVEVENLSGSEERSTTARAYEDYDTEFRSDFDMQHASSGARYEEYQPAYRYGYDLAAGERYAGRSWEDIESDARREWESRNPDSAWDRVKASVRHAWERVTS